MQGGSACVDGDGRFGIGGQAMVQPLEQCFLGKGLEQIIGGFGGEAFAGKFVAGG